MQTSIFTTPFRVKVAEKINDVEDEAYSFLSYEIENGCEGTIFEHEFIELIESIVRGSRNTFRNDKPAIRMLFVDMLDSYSKDGQLTDAQVQNWIMTDRELRKLIKISKG